MIFLLSLWLAWVPTFCHSLEFDAALFQNTIENNYSFKALNPKQIKRYSKALNKTVTVPIKHTYTAQSYYSFLSIQEKLSRRKNRKKPRTASAALCADGFAIFDGNHEILLRIYLGVPKISVRLLYAWPHLSRQDCLRRLRDAHLALMEHSHMQMAPKPFSYADMQNDNNRYLVDQLLLKIRTDQDGEVERIKGPDYAVMVKVNEGVPLAEAFAARILQESGIQYDPAWGDQIPARVREQVRSVLVEAQLTHPVLSQSVILNEPQKVRHIDVSALVAKPLATPCEKLLNYNLRAIPEA